MFSTDLPRTNVAQNFMENPVVGAKFTCELAFRANSRQFMSDKNFRENHEKNFMQNFETNRMVPSKSTYGIEIRTKIDMFDLSIEHEHVFSIVTITDLHSEISVWIFESAVNF